MLTLYAGNAQELQLEGLTDTSGQVINDATVTARVLSQPDRLPVTTTDPIPLAPLGANGNYSATFPADADLTPGARYVVIVRAEKGNLVAEWEEEAFAKKRRF